MYTTQYSSARYYTCPLRYYNLPPGKLSTCLESINVISHTATINSHIGREKAKPRDASEQTTLPIVSSSPSHRAESVMLAASGRIDKTVFLSLPITQLYPPIKIQHSEFPAPVDRQALIAFEKKIHSTSKKIIHTLPVKKKNNRT